MVLNGDGTPPTQALLSSLPPSLRSMAQQLSPFIVSLYPWVMRSCALGSVLFFRAPIYLPPPPPPCLGSILPFSLPEARLCGFHQGPS